MPVDYEEERYNDLAWFCHFLEGQSWRTVFHRWKRAVAIGIRNARRRPGHPQRRAFCRISAPTEAAEALCQFALVFAPKRNIPKPRPGRCSELGLGTDGNRVAGRRDAPRWNSGSR